MFLVSPQTRMYYAKFAELGNKVNKSVLNIPPQAYVPIPTGIANMAKLILQNVK